MSLIPQKYLDAGPDVLHYGSKRHKQVGGKGIIFDKAFIYTKHGKPKLIVANKDQAHVHITELPETIEAMFGPDAEEFKKIAANLYAEGPSIRTRAQQIGNIFGRCGIINGISTIMLWNIGNDKQDVADLINDLGYDPEHTVLVCLHDELGYAKYFIQSNI
jgi:hypothetical protein